MVYRTQQGSASYQLSPHCSCRHFLSSPLLMSSYLTPKWPSVHFFPSTTVLHLHFLLFWFLPSLCHAPFVRTAKAAGISTCRQASSFWNHHSQQRSGLPPDLAQTLILANQHTSQLCPEVLLALKHPAGSKSSCKQSVICHCLWIKESLCGLSAYVGQCVFFKSFYSPFVSG